MAERAARRYQKQMARYQSTRSHTEDDLHPHDDGGHEGDAELTAEAKLEGLLSISPISFLTQWKELHALRQAKTLHGEVRIGVGFVPDEATRLLYVAHELYLLRTRQYALVKQLVRTYGHQLSTLRLTKDDLQALQSVQLGHLGLEALQSGRLSSIFRRQQSLADNTIARLLERAATAEQISKSKVIEELQLCVRLREIELSPLYVTERLRATDKHLPVWRPRKIVGLVRCNGHTSMIDLFVVEVVKNPHYPPHRQGNAPNPASVSPPASPSRASGRSSFEMTLENDLLQSSSAEPRTPGHDRHLRGARAATRMAIQDAATQLPGGLAAMTEEADPDAYRVGSYLLKLIPVIGPGMGKVHIHPKSATQSERDDISDSSERVLPKARIQSARVSIVHGHPHLDLTFTVPVSLIVTAAQRKENDDRKASSQGTKEAALGVRLSDTERPGTVDPDRLFSIQVVCEVERRLDPFAEARRKLQQESYANMLKARGMRGVRTAPASPQDSDTAFEGVNRGIDATWDSTASVLDIVVNGLSLPRLKSGPALNTDEIRPLLEHKKFLRSKPSVVQLLNTLNARSTPYTSVIDYVDLGVIEVPLDRVPIFERPVELLGELGPLTPEEALNESEVLGGAKQALETIDHALRAADVEARSQGNAGRRGCAGCSTRTQISQPDASSSCTCCGSDTPTSALAKSKYDPRLDRLDRDITRLMYGPQLCLGAPRNSGTPTSHKDHDLQEAPNIAVPTNAAPLFIALNSKETSSLELRYRLGIPYVVPDRLPPIFSHPDLFDILAGYTELTASDPLVLRTLALQALRSRTLTWYDLKSTSFAAGLQFAPSIAPQDSGYMDMSPEELSSFLAYWQLRAHPHRKYRPNQRRQSVDNNLPLPQHELVQVEAGPNGRLTYAFMPCDDTSNKQSNHAMSQEWTWLDALKPLHGKDIGELTSISELTQRMAAQFDLADDAYWLIREFAQSRSLPVTPPPPPQPAVPTTPVASTPISSPQSSALVSTPSRALATPQSAYPVRAGLLPQTPESLPRTSRRRARSAHQTLEASTRIQLRDTAIERVTESRREVAQKWAYDPFGKYDSREKREYLATPSLFEDQGCCGPEGCCAGCSCGSQKSNINGLFAAAADFSHCATELHSTPLRMSALFALIPALPLQARPTTEVVLSAPHVGISVVSSDPAEIAYISIEGTHLEIGTTVEQTTMEVRVRHIQADLQSPRDDPAPVLFAPVVTPEELAADPSHAFVHLSVCQSHVSPKYPASAYRYVSTQLRKFVLNITERHIWDVLRVLNDLFPDSEADSTDYSAVYMDRRPLLGGNVRSKQGLIFIGELDIKPLEAKINFQATPAVRATYAGLSYNPLKVALTAGSGVFGNISASITLPVLYSKNIFGNIADISARLTQFYILNGLSQVGKILGSVDVLGNPLDLVSRLGSGVKDFFYEPAKGLVKSPRAFSSGLARGSRSLIANITTGAASAISRVTGALGRGLGVLSLDDKFNLARERANAAHVGGIYSGVRAGLVAVVRAVASSIGGIFRSPYEGCIHQGVVGLFKGILKGAIGAIFKLATGALDLLHNIARGLHAQLDSFFNNKRTGRVRLQRHCDRYVLPYDATSALGQSILRASARARRRAGLVNKIKLTVTDPFEDQEEEVGGSDRATEHDEMILRLLSADTASRSDLIAGKVTAESLREKLAELTRHEHEELLLCIDPTDACVTSDTSTLDQPAISTSIAALERTQTRTRLDIVSSSDHRMSRLYGNNESKASLREDLVRTSAFEVDRDLSELGITKELYVLTTRFLMYVNDRGIVQYEVDLRLIRSIEVRRSADASPLYYIVVRTKGGTVHLPARDQSAAVYVVLTLRSFLRDIIIIRASYGGGSMWIDVTDTMVHHVKSRDDCLVPSLACSHGATPIARRLGINATGAAQTPPLLSVSSSRNTPLVTPPSAVLPESKVESTTSPSQSDPIIESATKLRAEFENLIHSITTDEPTALVVTFARAGKVSRRVFVDYDNRPDVLFI